ncbi:MAG: acetolactate synthase large subunit [Chloroflexi bacterium RBG_13_52_14]|nr:MAG: acetolactate synthase large subunit [Chloroflexi bacterium RBG_13_52_14]
MATISGAEALVRCLIEEKVRYVFGIPGDQCNPITDAIYRLGRKKGMRFITARHEQAAAHMADAWARVTGEPGVCLATVGPGVADLVPGVYTAWADSIPMVVLGAQNQTWRCYPEHGSMQALDQVPLMAPITKWQAMVNDVRRMPHLVQLAIRTAVSGRPGPVYLDLPSNVLCDKLDTEACPVLPPERYRATTPPVADERLIQKAAAMLAKAKLPLIHTGGGVLRAGAWDEVAKLAEYLSAPVTTSIGGRGAIPEDHPLCLIPTSLGAIDAQSKADVVLLVGGRMGDTDFWGRPPFWGEINKQRFIQIDIEPQNIGLNRPVDLALLGDARATLRALLKAVRKQTKPKKETPQLKEARQAQEAWLEGWKEGAYSKNVPIHPLRLMREVREFFPRNAICAIDGGNTAVWAFYQNRIYEPRTFLWAADSGHLGAGVPYAVGAKLARPDLPVYCITGDGSFGFNAMEMETAAREKLPIVVIIANDNAWGMIKGGQKLVYQERYCGVDFTDVRYDQLAQALGCYGERVTKPAQIRPALKRAVASGLPAVLDVVVDAEVNLVPPDLVVLDSVWMEGCDAAGSVCVWE